MRGIIMTNEKQENIRTTLSLSISVKDKQILKQMAYEQNTSIAAIIHGWIEEHADAVTKSERK